MDAQFSKHLGYASRSSSKTKAEIQSEQLSAREMRNLFHDINNCLMLILLVSDKIEARKTQHHVSQAIGEHTTHFPQNADDEMSISESPTAQIIKHNAVALRDMMHSLQQIMAHDVLQNTVSAVALQWTVNELVHFMRHQQSQWRLLLPPDGELLVKLAPCDGGLVQIHPPALARSLQNLIRNASEAYITATQSLDEVAAIRASLKIFISGELRDGHYVISIQDNGPGIASEMQPYLFQEAVSSKQQSDVVYGQGLVSARDCLASFGGKLDLYHSDNKGSIFCLTLPWVKIA